MNVFLGSVDRILHEQGRKRPWLSAAAEIPISTINNWFAYDRWPAVDQALAVAKVLETDLHTMMGERALNTIPAGPRMELVRLSYELPDYLLEEAVAAMEVLVRLTRKDRHMMEALRSLPSKDPNVGV